MRTRYYLMKQNEKLKTIVIVLCVIIAAMGIFIVHEIRNDDDMWNEGFTSCIEENNLYERYGNEQ